MCGLISAFSAREEGVIFFLPVVLVTLLSTIICAFFVSYFIERCSFAILVRKKKKKTYTREHVHIYMLCIILS